MVVPDKLFAWRNVNFSFILRFWPKIAKLLSDNDNPLTKTTNQDVAIVRLIQILALP